MFVASLAHTPEQCFGRKEYAAEGKRWAGGLKSSAKKLGVKVHGAYVCTNEHTFYFVLESNDYKAVSELLGPPMLTHSSGRLSPGRLHRRSLRPILRQRPGPEAIGGPPSNQRNWSSSRFFWVSSDVQGIRGSA